MSKLEHKYKIMKHVNISLVCARLIPRGTKTNLETVMKKVTQAQEHVTNVKSSIFMKVCQNNYPKNRQHCLNHKPI